MTNTDDPQVTWDQIQIFSQDDTIFSVALGGGDTGADTILVAGN